MIKAKCSRPLVYMDLDSLSEHDRDLLAYETECYRSEDAYPPAYIWRLRPAYRADELPSTVLKADDRLYTDEFLGMLDQLVLDGTELVVIEPFKQ
jgi:hypothetical protein